jgi:predicted transcriptional regulator
MVFEEKTTTEEKNASFVQYNAEGKQLEAFLGPLEASVLQTIWDSKKHSITVREVFEAQKKKKANAYTTIMNTMDRLYEKGLLDRKIEKSKSGAYIYYVYWSKFEEKNFRETAICQVLGSLLDNFGDLVTTCLIEKNVFNDQELEALKERVEKNLKEKQAKN